MRTRLFSLVTSELTLSFATCSGGLFTVHLRLIIDVDLVDSSIFITDTSGYSTVWLVNNSQHWQTTQVFSELKSNPFIRIFIFSIVFWSVSRGADPWHMRSEIEILQVRHLFIPLLTLSYALRGVAITSSAVTLTLTLLISVLLTLLKLKC